MPINTLRQLKAHILSIPALLHSTRVRRVFNQLRERCYNITNCNIANRPELQWILRYAHKNRWKKERLNTINLVIMGLNMYDISLGLTPLTAASKHGRVTIPDDLEIWYDPKHKGALRVLDKAARTITGTDPARGGGVTRWQVWYTAAPGRGRIRVDFSTKPTHRGEKIMVARYAKRRNELRWPDGNRWQRIRTPAY